MSITAAEVVRHARPIADLLGITKLADLQDGWVCLLIAHPEADSGLPPEEAAAMILGLIVAKSKTFEAMEYRAWSGIYHFTEYQGERSLESVFIAACAALARANGIEPATQTKENP